MMFSKEYFKYLLTSNRYLLILVFFLFAFNAIGNTIKGLDLLLQGFLAVLFSFILPIIVFYHVHDKRAVDSYFALPVDRKRILATSILFCFLIVYAGIAIGILAFAYRSDGPFNTAFALLIMALAALVLVMYHSALYLIGNDIVDGVIMMGAYTALPLSITSVLSSFAYSFVAGNRYVNLTLVSLFSPLYMAGELLTAIVGNEKTDFIFIVGLIGFGLLSAWLLHRSYVLRKAERANQCSNSFFSYPLVINLYLTVSLFMIATLFNLHYKTLGSFFRNYFVLYLLLFAVYVAAYFVYRRKFYFNYKLPAFFLAMMVVSLLFAYGARNTRGFGLGDHYVKAGGKDQCHFDVWYENPDPKIADLLEEECKERPQWLNVSISINNDEMVPRKIMSETTADILDVCRKKAIDDFYENDYHNSKGTNLVINAYGEYNHYNYQMDDAISFEDMLKLAQDPCVNIVLASEKGEYRLNADGKLTLINTYQ